MGRRREINDSYRLWRVIGSRSESGWGVSCEELVLGVIGGCHEIEWESDEGAKGHVIGTWR